MVHSYQNTVSFIVETLSKMNCDCPQLLSNHVSEDLLLILSQGSFTSLDAEKTFLKILGKRKRFVHPGENLLSEVSKTH